LFWSAGGQRSLGRRASLLAFSVITRSSVTSIFHASPLRTPSVHSSLDKIWTRFAGPLRWLARAPGRAYARRWFSGVAKECAGPIRAPRCAGSRAEARAREAQ